jgi:hypothetical protein
VTRKNKIKQVIAVLVLPLLFLLLLLKPVYFGAPIRGRIVDGVTGAPIDNAIVVAFSQTGSLLHSGSGGSIALLEAVTDTDGNYRLPGWGPKLAPTGRVRNNAPSIFVYKSGYVPLGADNHYGNKGSISLARLFIRSQRDGETLELQRFDGQIGDYYSKHADALRFYLGLFGLGHPCLWKEIPLLLTSLRELDTQFAQAGIVNQFTGQVSIGAEACATNYEQP